MATTQPRIILYALLLITSSVIPYSSKINGVEAIELQPTETTRAALAVCYSPCKTDQDCVDANCGSKCFTMKRPFKISNCLSF
ncbi:hypothetical protein ABFS82_07G081800 [Erythranthe guttata]|uniref:WAP domain-containing protein n=1 Tax=Erythranthe guttata TaxID=4155 RepID=A0A022Q6G4_ERYGU|nr:hypothetical protein MIMGU_mgv1a017318mg [Erythranthe guttata]